MVASMNHPVSPGAMVGVAIAIFVSVGVALWIAFIKKKRGG